jgi:hypothetical protein
VSFTTLELARLSNPIGLSSLDFPSPSSQFFFPTLELARLSFLIVLSFLGFPSPSSQFFTSTIEFRLALLNQPPTLPPRLEDTPTKQRRTLHLPPF